ncbi:Cap [Molossus molossus associated gemykibivirus 3]|nr:Cap [Molossus molossus associated gemykibivirus 3]
MFYHAFPQSYFPELVRDRASVSKMPRTHFGRPRGRYSRRRTRRSAGPRRRYRRTIRRTTRTMSRTSRRRILNLTSRKKQDNMLPYATNQDGSGGTPTSFGIPASTGGVFIWNATARDRVSSSAESNAVSLRTSDVCFMRGLKERIILTPNNDTAWRWRRITFTIKGDVFGPIGNRIETSRGWNRLLVNSAGSTTLQSLQTVLFQGVQNVDWMDQFTAKVDTGRVDLKSDVTRILASGNSKGKFHRFNLWYPMNKNLVYANDENGEGETLDVLSTNSKHGMGDYYVVDFFSGLSTSAADTLDFNPEATLYWHEK